MEEPNAGAQLLPEAGAGADAVGSQLQRFVRLGISNSLAWKLMRYLCRGLLFEDDPLREPLLDVLARYLARRNR